MTADKAAELQSQILALPERQLLSILLGVVIELMQRHMHDH